MPTKLKKPITVTITHVENAVVTYLLIQKEPSLGYDDSNPRHRRLNAASLNNQIGDQLLASLQSQGINWRTWEPPQPFKIGAHETAFNPDGSIKVGCTDIDRATLLEVLKRSDQAMGKSEPEWPKYFKHGAGWVYRCTSDIDGGQYFNDGHWLSSTSSPLMRHVKIYPAHWTPLTRAEAAAILGRDV